MESDNPDIKWALDLLSFDPLYEPHLIAKYWMKIPPFVVGPGLACYINHTRGLKAFSRPYLHLGITAVLFGWGYAAESYVNRRNARRDAILRDYIIRHPEDFPPPERKKHGELFNTWIPIR
ncbi:uncharacterized protein LOC122508323 [Leptopilina heterotoma]|uniref:uncharacterized protein LOC122508323 n=1 Tax=Leptopilina heterotoma TaxID=63436 RepID=UPI001CA90EFD|nr:uncharacterized protein LOC122508323 [Leptopilina heterotoma]